MSSPTLFHYTCDHGHKALGSGSCTLLPLTGQRLTPAPPAGGAFVWLTDLDVPFRAALGLTSVALRCDRTAHRYRVTGGDATPLRWLQARRLFPPAYRDALERAPGAMPAHWWVAGEGVPAVYDPIVRPR